MLVHFVAFLQDIGYVFTLHLVVNKLLYVLLTFPLSFYLKVREVFAPVYPVSNCSLNLQYDWYQYFLYHLGVLDTFWVSQYLFNSWIDF